MRVAMFCDCYIPVINGVVTSIACLKAALEAEGHTVTLYVPAVPKHRDTDSAIHRFTSFVWPLQPEERFSIPWPPKTMREFKADDCDVIHVHTPFNVGLLGWWKAWRAGRPMVFTHHTLWEEYVHYLPMPRSWGRAIALGLCGFFFRRSRRIIAPSEEVRARLVSQGVRRPVEVIPTGIDPELFHGGDASRVPVAPDERLFLFIGRVGKEKSIDFVLKAFAEVLKEEPRYRLILIGDGPERAALENQARQLGLGDRCQFLGYQPRADLKHYLAAARGFLFASLTETQGLVSLEAQAGGVPVVGVRASGTSEAVKDGHTGFLLEPGDLKGFKDAILRLGRDDELYSRLHENAAVWAEGFSSKEMAHKMEDAYKAALEAYRIGR